MKYKMQWKKIGRKRWFDCLINPYENKKEAFKHLRNQLKQWGTEYSYRIIPVRP